MNAKLLQKEHQDKRGVALKRLKPSIIYTVEVNNSKEK